jgi:FkbM family methyltransferase
MAILFCAFGGGNRDRIRLFWLGYNYGGVLMIKDNLASAEKESAIIFGAGSVGFDFMRLLKQAGVYVSAFLDNYKSESLPYAGKPVYRPDSAPKTIDRSTTVIIGVWRPDVPQALLEEQLSDSGWANVVTMAGFIRRNYDRFGDFYWRTERGYYERPDRIKVINQVRAIWADALSLNTYEHLLKLRRDFDDSDPPPVDPHEYTPEGIPGLLQFPLRYVDGGAYDGDVLAKFIDSGYEIESAALFEPDMRNFKLLVQRHSTKPPVFPVFSYPCALSDRQERESFHQDMEVAVASGFSRHGEIAVPCVRLDSALKGFKPNFIKLDVEGAELSVLEGSVETLRTSRPSWAVCVYHKADDLWMVPYWFMSKADGLDYKYYLRQHSNGLAPHCFYAAPERK